ncbi:MAG: YfhO family protein [Oscillospiraceae bacterium]|nr:YfhO family protein [Oscillospiraceae bacterium]
MQKRLSFHKQALVLYSASFLIPLCILTGCMYVLKIAPFGEDSLLLIDSSSQYVNYLGYFRSVLRGENDLLYTFSKNLGGDLLSLAAYYMLSPFNILFLLADTRTLPLFFTAIVLLKLSFSGLSYYYAASRLFGHKLTGLAFSTAYALMGYNMVYEWNIMWLDGIMILPLLFLGLYRLVSEKKIGSYAFCIAYALITSFYTGYMLCAASVLFLAALLTVFPVRGKDLLKTGGRFAYGSCVGGFAAAIVWLPTIMTLGGNRLNLSETSAPFWKTDLLDFTAKFIPGAANTMEIYEGLPHVFCGTVVLVLVLLFFFNSKISRRIRLTGLAVIALFLASFCITPLDVAWHGFSPNRLFNFRYSFLFSFVLILIGQYSLESLDGITVRKMLLPVILLLSMAATALLRKPELAIPGCFITLAVLALLLFLPVLSRRSKAGTCILLTLIAIFELGINCGLTWDKMCQGTLKMNYRDFYYYIDYVEPAISAAKTQEDGLYRIEKTFFKDQNDPMLFGYNGLSHFSSTEKSYVMTFLEKMGMRNYFNVWSAYLTGSTADVDALLGVKYLLSNDDSAASKGYELISSPYGIGLYRNPNALPVAVLADNSLMDVSMDSKDYFALHNDIWSGLTGQAQSVLLEEPAVRVTLQNLTGSLQDDGTHLYTKTDPEQSASLRFEISISHELPLYCYFTAPVEEQSVTLLVNGESAGAYFDAFRWNMACTGTYAPGETLVVELSPNADSFSFDEGWFYYEDRAALAEAAEQVKQSPVTLNQASSSRLTGSFTADTAKTLFFTIPWDDGWHLTMDGEKVSFDTALGTFLAVSAAPGAHTFEMYFLPPGFTAGACLTAVSAIMAFAWCFFRWKQKKM